MELSLASEAMGLVRSLDWEIQKGPNRHENILKNINASYDTDGEDGPQNIETTS